MLPEAVADLFSAHQLLFKADRIVLGIGPGSYTGVRVGASYALGLAAVWHCPVVGVSSLTALLDGDSTVQRLAFDARKEQVYCADYEARWENNRLVSLQELSFPHKTSRAEASVHSVYREDVPPSGLRLLEAGSLIGKSEYSLLYL